MWQFVVQVQVVFGVVEIVFLCFFYGIDYFFQIFKMIVVIVYVVNCYGVQYGGDVVGDYYGVMVVYC